jgi:hypothetical protein
VEKIVEARKAAFLACLSASFTRNSFRESNGHNALYRQGLLVAPVLGLPPAQPLQSCDTAATKRKFCTIPGLASFALTPGKASGYSAAPTRHVKPGGLPRN